MNLITLIMNLLSDDDGTAKNNRIFRVSKDFQLSYLKPIPANSSISILALPIGIEFRSIILYLENFCSKILANIKVIMFS